jgi:hypothetical protein
MWQGTGMVKCRRGRTNAVRPVRRSLSTSLLRDRGFGSGIDDWTAWSATSPPRLTKVVKMAKSMTDQPIQQ